MRSLLKRLVFPLYALGFAACLLCLFDAPTALAADRTVIQTVAGVTATTTSTSLLPARQNRNYLLIINMGSADVYVKPGSVQSGTEGVVIPALGNWEPFTVPMDEMFFKSSTGSQPIRIIEGGY